MAAPSKSVAKPDTQAGNGSAAGAGAMRFLHFSELLKRRVCAGSIKDRIGRVADLVFGQFEPFPEAIGIYVEHGWGNPTEFIPWDKVIKIEDDAIFVQPRPGDRYPRSWTSPGGSSWTSI